MFCVYDAIKNVEEFCDYEKILRSLFQCIFFTIQLKNDNDKQNKIDYLLDKIFNYEKYLFDNKFNLETLR